MATPAYNRARACFALAASTTFEGERASAISRGTAIAQAAGLSLDLFDIPGRVKSTRSAPRAPVRPDLFRSAAETWERGRSAPNQYTAESVAEVMRAFHESLRGHSFFNGSDAADAFSFTAAAMSERASRMEREQRAAFPTPEAAANFLWSIGFPTYPDVDDADQRIWKVQQGDALVDYDSDEVIGLAMDHKRMKGAA